MKLRDATVRSLTCNDGKPKEIADEDSRGLYLRVLPSGSKSWILRYRMKDKSYRLGLGRYPDVALSSARRLAQDAREKIAIGENPMAPKVVVAPATVEDAFEAHLASGLKASTQRVYRELFDRWLRERFGAMAITEIDRRTIVAHVREIGATSQVLANRTLALIRAVLGRAVAEGQIDISPLAGVGKPFRETSRDRTLSDDEIRNVLVHLGDPPLGVSRSMAQAILLALLTMQRCGNVAQMRREDVSLSEKTWTIGAQDYKTGRPMVVPLSDRACSILEELIGEDRAPGPVFPGGGANRAGEGITRHGLTRAFNRVCRAAGVENASIHDLRRTAATVLASERAKYPPHVIEALLGQKVAKGATAVYLRYDYVSEKREALETWVRILDSIGPFPE